MENKENKPKPLANIFLKELIDYTDELKNQLKELKKEDNFGDVSKIKQLDAQVTCLETLRERIFHLALVNYPKK